jgi:hypothetical protein
LALFWTVALAPAIYALLSSTFAVSSGPHSSAPLFWSIAGICPAVSGYWIAAHHSEHHLKITITGTLMSCLLFAVNWIILVEGCCKTLVLE